jgi:hypothetical protein
VGSKEDSPSPNATGSKNLNSSALQDDALRHLGSAIPRTLNPIYAAHRRVPHRDRVFMSPLLQSYVLERCPPSKLGLLASAHRLNNRRPGCAPVPLVAKAALERGLTRGPLHEPPGQGVQLILSLPYGQPCGQSRAAAGSRVGR